MAILHYFPCIPVFAELIKQQQIQFDDSLPFQRSTFRNRTIIVGSNGIIQLSIPIIGGRSVNLPYRDIEIDYKNDWQRDHFRTLCTVYANSPFFIFYKDELGLLYTDKTPSLFEWNIKCLKWVLEKLKLMHEVTFKIYSDEKSDEARKLTYTLKEITPKNYSSTEMGPFIQYPQIFQERNGFQPNLSIFDLLFHQGKEAKLFFKSA